MTSIIDIDDDATTTDHTDAAIESDPPSGPTTASLPALLADQREAETTSPLDTALVPAAEAALDPAAPTPDYARQIERMRKALGPAASGLSDDDLLRACQARSARPGSGKQRTLPLHATPGSPEMEAWVDGRPLDVLEQDAVKGIRNDGGTLGPAGKYELIIAGSPTPAAAAKKIVDEVGKRMMAIRAAAVATINQGRAERARLAGLDPDKAKYLAVRLPATPGKATP